MIKKAKTYNDNEEEKIEIACRHLIPRQLENHGLSDEKIAPSFDRKTISHIIKPINYNISHYPVANEIVHIVGAPSRTYNENADANTYYLPPISLHKSEFSLKILIIFFSFNFPFKNRVT